MSNVTTITTDVVVTSYSVVSEYTTYCPLATSWVENNSTIVVTEPTTVTVTNCPCTRSHTYTTTTTTVCPVSSAPAEESSVSQAPPTQAPVETTPIPQGGAGSLAVNGAVAGAFALAAALL